MGVFGHDQCAKKVRGIQNFHMDTRHWSDVAYTAIVCPHGYVFQCRWLNVQTGANGTDSGNRYWYAVCYLGGIDDLLTAAAKTAIIELLEYLRLSGNAGPLVNVHSDHKPTACPGPAISAWVRVGVPPPFPPPLPIVPSDGDEMNAAALLVIETYRYFREPDPAGLKHWTQRFYDAGKSGADALIAERQKLMDILKSEP